MLIGGGAVAVEFHLPRLFAVLGATQVEIVENDAKRRAELSLRFRRDSRISIEPEANIEGKIAPQPTAKTQATAPQQAETPPTAGPQPTARLTDPPPIAPVWVPFRSQMSAEGFAERLSRELEHPFQVQRQGPGTYQVFFESADSTERALLQAQVREFTGE